MSSKTLLDFNVHDGLWKTLDLINFDNFVAKYNSNDDDLRVTAYANDTVVCMRFPSKRILLFDGETDKIYTNTVNSKGNEGRLDDREFILVRKNEDAVFNVIRATSGVNVVNIDIACDEDTEKLLFDKDFGVYEENTKPVPKKKARNEPDACIMRLYILYWLLFDYVIMKVPIPESWLNPSIHKPSQPSDPKVDKLVVSFPNGLTVYANPSSGELDIYAYCRDIQPELDFNPRLRVISDAMLKSAIDAANPWAHVGYDYMLRVMDDDNYQNAYVYLALNRFKVYCGYAFVVPKSVYETEILVISANGLVNTHNIGKHMMCRIIDDTILRITSSGLGDDGFPHKLYLESLPGAIGFYLRLGFRVENRLPYVKGVGPEREDRRNVVWLSNNPDMSWIKQKSLVDHDLVVSAIMGRDITTSISKCIYFSPTKPVWIRKNKEADKLWKDYKKSSGDGLDKLREVHRVNHLNNLVGKPKFYQDEVVKDWLESHRDYKELYVTPMTRVIASKNDTARSRLFNENGELVEEKKEGNNTTCVTM